MRDPVLQFKDEDGTVHSEYIPPELTLLGLWIVQCKKRLGEFLNWDFYWWDIEHLYPPHIRKSHDMHFIQHVEEAHEGKPENREEEQHYYHLLYVYHREIEWMKLQLVKQEQLRKEEEIEGYPPHHYAYAFRWRYMEAKLDPEWNVLYHGVPYEDCVNLIDRDFEKRGWNEQLEELEEQNATVK